MTSPNVDVTITGSESVSGAAARAQAAIDSLQGRSIDVDINFRNGGAAAGFASSAGRAADSAGDAFRGFSDRVNRANDDMGGFRDAARQASTDLDRISSGRPIFNDSDVSNARSIRGEIERLSDAGSSGGFRQLESSSGSLRAIESSAGSAGREIRALESGSSRAAIELREVGGVFQAVESGGSLASRVLSSFGRALGDSERSGGGLSDVLDDVPGKLGNLAGIASTAGRALGLVGLAGLYSAAGSGIAAAAVGGMGFAAVIADIASSGPTLSKAKNLVTDFGQEFRKVAPQTTALAMPGLENMSDQVKAIGAAAAQMGLSHMPEMFRATSTALAQVIPTAKALEPAISPAVNAAEALVTQAPRIASAATPALIQFSNTVANSAQGLGDLAIVGAKTAGALGSSAVSVASAWGQRMEAFDSAFPKAIPGAADLLGGLFGGKSNQLDPGSTTASGASMAGNILGGFGAGAGLGAVLGGILGSVIPGAGTLAGAGLGAALLGGTGATVGGVMAFADNKLPQQDAAMAAGQRAGAVYGPGSPLAGSTAPLYPTMEERQQQQQQEQAQQQKVAAQPATQQLDGRQLANIHSNVGEAGPGFGGTASQLQQLNQEMNKAAVAAPQMQQSMQNVGSAAQQSMQQAGNAAQQASPQFQQGMNQMAQHAQQLPQQLAQPMQQVPQQAADAMQQMPQQAAQAMQPQPMADAMSSAVAKTVRQVQPEAESGGSDLGASTMTGAAQGATVNQDKVITVIEHIIKKIIQVGAEGLDSHSPSRVFAQLGASIPQGLAVGMESDSSVAVSASQRLMNQVTNGASSQLGGQQQGLQNQLAQQQQQAQQAAQQAQQAQAQAQQAREQQLQNQGFGILGPQGQQQTAAAMQAELQRAMQTGDTSKLPPEMRQQIEQQKQAMHQYADGQQFDKNRHDQLAKLGYSESTLERIQTNEADHEERRQAILGRRADNHEHALDLARHPTEAARKAMREQGDVTGEAYGEGTAEGMKRSQGKVGQAARDMVDAAGDETKKKAGIASPSKLFAGYGGDIASGFGGGMAAAITGATIAVQGVASDRALQLGYRWGTSMVDGIRSVLKMTDYQAAGFPNIENEFAKTALGKAGLLGVAGSGAMISKFLGVNFPTGGTASTPVVNQLHLTVNLDGKPFREMSAQVADGKIDQFINDLNNVHLMQVG